jgi:hypothetical protein
MQLREPFTEVVIGMTGMGKTYITRKIIIDYIKSDPKTGRKGRPVLVFDVNGEYEDYKAIDYDIDNEDEYSRAAEIRAIKFPKAYRIVPYHKNEQIMDVSEIMATCTTLMNHFRNGLLVLEDINKYTQSHFKKEVTATFIGNRHKGIDILVHYQNMKKIPPTVWENISFLRWHKQVGTIDNFGISKRMPNYEICKIAELIVDDQFDSGNTYFYLWVNIRYNKLINITEEMFNQAARNYLSLNPKEIKNMMNFLDEHNKKKFSNESDAIDDWISVRKARYLK